MLPDRKDERWKSLILDEDDYFLSSLPLKLLLSRLRLTVKLDSSESSLNESIEEMYDFLYKNEQNLEDDIKLIFE